MDDVKNLHMTPEEFRKWGRRVVDRVARYMEEVEEYPVLSRVGPGEIRARLPGEAPEEGEPFERILADVDEIVIPGLTHWQSPNFFGYFPANASGPAILGDLLSAGFGVQGMLWSTSPACTELETHVLDWLVSMLALPESFLSTGAGGGVIQDTASSATLCALLAARERITEGAGNAEGSDGTLTAYASTQAHSSLLKAVRIAGIGERQLRLVEVDETFALRPDDLEARISADRAAGLRPFFVMATVGTTSSNAMDPVRAIGEVARRHQLWLHVDAAMSGTAALCPEFRHLQDGLELSDSYCFNPHKWMLTNFDCDCFWVADRAALIRSLSVLPEYLRNQATESGAVIDYRDWHVPLGRRFRALKLWFVIRHYGVSGLRQNVRQHVALAREFRAEIEADASFEPAAPTPLNLVCFRHGDGDEKNQALLDTLNASGKLLLTHTKLDGKLTLRLAIGGTLTEARHVRAAWKRIQETAKALN